MGIEFEVNNIIFFFIEGLFIVEKKCLEFYIYRIKYNIIWLIEFYERDNIFFCFVNCNMLYSEWFMLIYIFFRKIGDEDVDFLVIIIL